MRCSLALGAALLLAACSAEQDGSDAAAGQVRSVDNNASLPAMSGDEAGNRMDAVGEEDGGNGAPSLAIIPEAFHGEWNGERSACGTGLSDTRLRIGGDRLHFYESIGDVRRVEVESDRVIDVTAEFRGEGETWQDERRLSLSADGDSLTVDAGPVRYRCG